MNPNIPGRTPPNREVTLDEFGLLAWLEETRILLPLKAVEAEFQVSGDLAEVHLDQVFHQTAKRPLDVTYTFPLPAGAAVFKCELIVNDRVIQARVEKQERAREIAREMKAVGRRTGLVEMERDNLFTLSLGNVQPDDLVVVRFSWFQILDHLQEMKWLTIPFTPGVRYIPGDPLLRTNRGSGSSDDTNQVPDASRISPPRIDQLHPDAARISVHGVFDMRFVKEFTISSSSHPMLCHQEGNEMSVTLAVRDQYPDRSLVLNWEDKPVETVELRSVSCIKDGHQYAMVRLDAPKSVYPTAKESSDYYFLVDRSGSMAGLKWDCTIDALHAFVRQLSDEDRVWITFFESGQQDFAEAPLLVSELKNDQGFQLLSELGVAGGTELAPAFEHVLKQIAKHSRKRETAIILITDGQVGNEAGIVKLLRNAPGPQVHTFGIDTAINDALLKQLAAENRGSCVLLTPNDDITGAVSRLGSRLCRPVLTHLALPKGWENSMPSLSDLHAGDHALLALSGPAKATSLEIKGTLEGKSKIYPFTLKTSAMSAPRLLWAKQSIDRLLALGKQDEAVELAIKYNLICRGAAFIAYDTKEKVSISTQAIEQPVMEVAVQCAKPSAAVKQAPMAAPSATRSINRIQTRIDSYFAPMVPLPTADPGPWKKQFPVRTQVVLDSWKGAARFRVLLFNRPESEPLLDLFCTWAREDLTRRMELLHKLVEDVSKKNDPALIKTFIETHVTDSKVALSMRVALSQIEI